MCTYLEVSVERFGDGWDALEVLHDHSGADDHVWALRVLCLVVVVKDDDITKSSKAS